MLYYVTLNISALGSSRLAINAYCTVQVPNLKVVHPFLSHLQTWGILVEVVS